MSEFYNKIGKEITLEEWGRLMQDREYKIIKQETMPDGKFVSTVWLGLDHGWNRDKLIIFETMVFAKEKGWGNEVETNRYSTLEEAIKGHEQMVKKYS